jgi:hypothetical protein
MARFQESPAKQAIRRLIVDATSRLQRQGLTYLGLPAEAALDVLALKDLLKNVICVASSEATLEETKRSIATVALRHRRFVAMDMWDYLAKEYPREELVADITFLDFYGGGLSRSNPFATEIAGLRGYFAKHANISAKAFVFAWTYMPRDRGEAKYLDALGKLLGAEDLNVLRSTSGGVAFRSVALRLLLRQHLLEHSLVAKLFHHAVYKRVMSTMILVFTKDTDPSCAVTLGAPGHLLDEPCYVYDAHEAVPRLVSVSDI